MRIARRLAGHDTEPKSLAAVIRCRLQPAVVEQKALRAYGLDEDLAVVSAGEGLVENSGRLGRPYAGFLDQAVASHGITLASCDGLGAAARYLPR